MFRTLMSKPHTSVGLLREIAEPWGPPLRGEKGDSRMRVGEPSIAWWEWLLLRNLFLSCLLRNSQ